MYHIFFPFFFVSFVYALMNAYMWRAEDTFENQFFPSAMGLWILELKLRLSALVWVPFFTQ